MKTTPHAGLRAPGSGPADPDAATAERRRLWDRSRFLAGLTAVYLVLALKVMADHPGIVPFADAVRVVARDHQWIFWLLGAEAARQLHLLAAERLPGYRRFWRRRVFGGWERWSHRRLDDWTRFRVARLAKIAVWVALLALVLAAVLGTSPAVALFEAPALLSRALPLVVQIAVPLVVIIVVFAGLLWFLSRSGVETYFPGDVTTRFADVWGQDHVVERIRQSLVLLERPGEIERRGGYVPGGLLLWGPPGTGKTLIAEAVAGETGKPYVVVDSGAFTGTFAGVGVLKVRTLFRKLRRLALRYGGVVILFDDADALGGRGRPGPPAEGGGLSGCHGPDYLSEESRSVLAFPGEPLGGGGGDARTQRALLTELSGLKEPRGLFNRTVRRLLGMRPKPPPPYRVLVILATERPDALDRALLGPGRVDRVHRVGHPSRAGRLRTYQGYFAEVAHELTAEQIGRLAAITPYATGATIKDLVNESLISAVRDGRETITWPDVLSARRQRLGPDEHVERERHAVAVHEACHAVVAYVTRSHQEIGLATIEKGAGDLGPSNGSTRWKSEYEADIMVSLASLAGERMFFGEDSSSGVRGDLHAATCLSALMESSWGMGSGVTSLPALRELGITGGRPGVLGERVEDNLARLLAKTGDLLAEHRRDVLCLAHALETHRTLDGDDVVAILRRRRGPVVDGTMYASDEFYRDLEEYHAEAALAHREHRPVARDLPGAAETITPVPPGDGSTVPAPETATPLAFAAPGTDPDWIGAPGTAPAWPGAPGTAPAWPGALGTAPAWPGASGGDTPGSDPAWPGASGGDTSGSDPAWPAAHAGVGASPPDAGWSGASPVVRGPAPLPLAAGEGDEGRPEIVPWGSEQPPPPPRAVPLIVDDTVEQPPPRGRTGRLWVVAASLFMLVGLAIILALALTGVLTAGPASGTETGAAAAPGPAPGIASPWLLIALFVVVVAVVVGVGLTTVAVKGVRVAQAKAERDRDEAHARAQLLAAALDPDTAMRLLGYDGNGRRELGQEYRLTTGDKKRRP
ncbi:AAA family ATPase [Nonomuraea ferruginea]|uniref:AAA family ATPase n=1 Tax=Nonomuraea ferruginea TaxID=46174 RepID=A0ABT4SQJ4_9ACTN|nr:AAA family ATPase [Nonomuraea ferruginea]MDA0639349.1 AAA family ATPase [Nonomuraea ferruginea]